MDDIEGWLEETFSKKDVELVLRLLSAMESNAEYKVKTELRKIISEGYDE
jgi:hypothetical protein